jgi:glycosyltransferase 2 family protein
MRLDRKSLVGIAVSLALLAAIFLFVDLGDVVEQLRRADPLWYALAVVVATLAIPVRALRWQVMLTPVAPAVPFAARNAATAIGFAANNVLPARAGEFARAYVLGRLARIPASTAFGTLVVERIFDSLVIVALLFVAMATPQFPAGTIAGVDPRHAAAVLALAMLGITAVLFALVYAPTATLRLLEAAASRVLPERLRRPALEMLHSFLAGLAVLRSPRLFLLSLGWAIAQWVFLALGFHFALLAFDIQTPGFVGALFLQSVVVLAVAAPSSPGYVGTFHAGAVLGLGLWGVAAEQAVSFAIAMHIGGFVTVTLLGAYYVWRLGLSWDQIEASKHVVEDEADRGQPAEPAARGSTP